MRRRGEEYWRKAIERQASSGMSAAKFCRTHHLQRGTFLRWRKRLGDSVSTENGLVEILEGNGLHGGRDEYALEVRVGPDIRIAVHAGADPVFIGALVAAIRGMA